MNPAPNAEPSPLPLAGEELLLLLDAPVALAVLLLLVARETPALPPAMSHAAVNAVMTPSAVDEDDEGSELSPLESPATAA